MASAEQDAEAETRPTKSVTSEITVKVGSALRCIPELPTDFNLLPIMLLVQVAARVTQVDFDGLADGRAIRNCLGNVKPRKLILVHGTETTTAELKKFVESSIPLCEAVFTPNVMECIDIESDTNVYKLAVKESLYTSAVFRKVWIGD